VRGLCEIRKYCVASCYAFLSGFRNSNSCSSCKNSRNNSVIISILWLRETEADERCRDLLEAGL
jgi:hypothetical protein